jgi:DNA-binding protein H-NS
MESPMAKRVLNYSKMSLAELLQLRDEIETALNGRIAMEHDELQSKMAELAALTRKRSKTLASVRRRGSKVGRARKPHPLKGKKVKPRYRGPKGETWAGRGLAPNWLTELEKKGKKREQFLVSK